MQLQWPSRGLVLVDVDERRLKVVGEALLERCPDFLIFPEYITHWEDGAPLDPERKRELLAEIIEEAGKRGWIFEIREGERP
ncbi:hypothetical protein AGRA3207_005730 [Actinomadura graeca]|uniref:Uncharacterized protein n=1 Tax=Actinomadura graeca TaxID=2750812 RepID=A0ABX8QZZ0_9ACTN|nr:Imm74 family immunity protein [Actinomadura graeca]QXJ24411.1 hypothetical protein AGRA3207_005730 [Actinomadura graeca]